MLTVKYLTLVMGTGTLAVEDSKEVTKMSDSVDRPPTQGVWDPIQALKNLTMEKALDSTDTPEMVARRLFKENLPVAVMAICHLATYSDTEVVRFNAAKFVVERTMGPAERVIAQDGKHAWDDIYENVVTEAEGYLSGK